MWHTSAYVWGQGIANIPSALTISDLMQMVYLRFPVPKCMPMCVYDFGLFIFKNDCFIAVAHNAMLNAADNGYQGHPIRNVRTGCTSESSDILQALNKGQH